MFRECYGEMPAGMSREGHLGGYKMALKEGTSAVVVTNHIAIITVTILTTN